MYRGYQGRRSRGRIMNWASNHLKVLCVVAVLVTLQHTASSAADSVRCRSAADGGASLLDAIKNGSLDALAELLACGVDANATISVRGFTGINALHLTAAANRLDMTTVLIEAGANVNARSASNRLTPLHLAASEGARDVALALIAAGAEIDADAADLRTPLHVAARRNALGARGIGQLLVEKGANVNARTSDGTAPLHMAMWQNRDRLARTLLEAGADANAINAQGYTALHFAAARRHGHDAAVMLVENGAMVEPPRRENVPSPLLIAVRSEAARTALLLIEHGANFRVKDESGTPLLTLAERKGLYDVAVRILREDESLRPTDPTALLPAATDADAARLVLRLLADGADVNVRTETSSVAEGSLLHLAAERGSHRVARLLLDRGMDASGGNSDGQTPLHLAAGSGSREVVLMLLERHAPVDARDEDGLTPLHEAAYHNSLPAAGLLIANGADVNAEGPANWTPLHFALLKKEDEDWRALATMLIRHGADLDAKTLVAGWTPLHLAVGLDEPEIVGTLVHHGSDVHAQTNIGAWLPWHLAQDKGKAVKAALEAAGGEDRETADAPPPRVFGHGVEFESEIDFYSMPNWFSGGGGEVARGSFTARGADERLVFERFGWNADVNEFVHLAGLTDMDGRTRVLWLADDNFEFQTLCRDPVTGLDHAVFFRSPGGASPGEVVYMNYDSHRGTFVESFADISDPEFHDYIDEGSRAAAPRTLGRGRADDGTCLWRDKKRAHETFKTAMAVLRIGKSVELSAYDPAQTYHLPVRALDGEAVRKWLQALNGIVTFEGAVYADDAGRDSWLIVQVLGTRLWDADGAVLLLDRRNGTWRTIYDVASGGSKQLSFPMRGMVVKGDRLFVSLCTNCEWWGEYGDFVVDLHSNVVLPLDRDTEAARPREESNPLLQDVHRSL